MSDQTVGSSEAGQVASLLTSSPQPTEAELAIQEINAAADVATAALAVAGASEASSSPSTDEQPKRSPESFRRDAAFYAKRVETQKKRGKDELSKIYVGAVAIKREITINDINIASSAERFAGLIDLSVYTLTRRGAALLSATQAENIIEEIEKMVAAYGAKAKEARETSRVLLDREKSATFDGWLQPEYDRAALSVTMSVKAPVSLRLIESLKMWDEAIYNLTVLNWNGKVDSAQAAQLRAEERRAHTAIYRFAARSLIGLRRKLNSESDKRAPKADSAAAPQGEAAVAA